MFNFLMLCMFRLCILCIVCKCLLFHCHRVSTQLQLNISYHTPKMKFVVFQERWKNCEKRSLPVPVSVCRKQFGSKLADFHKIWYLRIFSKICRENSSFLDFKLSPCSEYCICSFGYFPGVIFWFADVSEPTISSIFRGWMWSMKCGWWEEGLVFIPSSG
jgi:hypothetical protein